MILYYAPGGCSLADHIALIETALPYRLIRVDRGKRTEDGRDFLTINPKGLLPALELDDGTVLTENLAILVYIAHRAGALLPENGLDRWRALEATSPQRPPSTEAGRPGLSRGGSRKRPRAHAAVPSATRDRVPCG